MRKNSNDIGNIQAQSVSLNLCSLYHLSKLTISITFTNDNSGKIIAILDSNQQQSQNKNFKSQKDESFNTESSDWQPTCTIDQFQQSISSYIVLRQNSQEKNNNLPNANSKNNNNRQPQLISRLQESVKEIQFKSERINMQTANNVRYNQNVSIYIPIKGSSFKKILKNPTLVALLQLSNKIVVPQIIQYRVYIENCLEKSGINIQQTSNWKRLGKIGQESYYQILFKQPIQVQGIDLQAIQNFINGDSNSTQECTNQKLSKNDYIFIQRIKARNAEKFTKQELFDSFDMIYLNSQDRIGFEYQKIIQKSRKSYQSLICSARFTQRFDQLSFDKIKEQFDFKILNSRTVTLQDEQIDQMLESQIQNVFAEQLRKLQSLNSSDLETFQLKSFQLVRKMMPSKDQAHIVFKTLISNLMSKIKQQAIIKDKRIAQLQKQNARIVQQMCNKRHYQKNTLKKKQSIMSLKQPIFSLNKSKSSQNSINNSKEQNDSNRQNKNLLKFQKPNHSIINFKKTQLSQVQEIASRRVAMTLKEAALNRIANSEPKKKGHQKASNFDSVKPQSSIKAKRWQ